MTFRSEGDLIRAANGHIDLTNLIIAYLLMWRDHANGVYDVWVPDSPFSIVVETVLDHKINFRIIHTKTISWSEPQYYDVDSDYYQESYGSSANHYGDIVRYDSELRETRLSIKLTILLQDKATMLHNIKQHRITDIAQRERKEREARIAELSKELDQLKGQA